MKAKLGHYVQWLREGFLQMLRLHPVEAGLIALGCIGCLVAYETDSDDTLVRLALVPLAFAVALAFNNLAGLGPWRKVYWVCWAPFVPFALWGGLEEWLASEPSFITFGILAPLALLLCRRAPSASWRPWRCCSVAVPCATSGSSTTSWCGCVRASSLRSSPM